MPSSTSVSEHRTVALRLDRFTVIVLSTIVVSLALLEIVSRERFDSSSKVQRRELSERARLLGVRDSPTISDPHVALVGNSLMLEGVDEQILKTTLDPAFAPTSYFVLGTNYYDWYFGLRRLFAEGSRPRYIVLGLSPNQLATSHMRGDITARYLVQQSDLLDAVRKTHMDATDASGFILAHYSEFYSTRDIFRSYVMSRALPSVANLLQKKYAAFKEAPISDSVLKSLAAARLSALDQLCRQYGARFLFVIPPSYQKGEQAIVEAGREAGVPVFLPVKYGEFDRTYYQADGFHMNEKGARIFTTRLAAELNEEMAK
jgi:hypothetical protein